jgi:hypothetical protein
MRMILDKRKRETEIAMAITKVIETTSFSESFGDAIRQGDREGERDGLERLLAVGFWYRDFSPTADEEVTALLKRSTAMSVTHERLVEAGAGVLVPGVLTIPENPRGIVAFAHGSGSSPITSATGAR